MGYYVNPSAESFAAIARSKTYVDKTGLIEYMNTVVQTDRMLVCSSRPRRFGKSFAAKMLAAYYSRGADSKDIFQNFNTCKCNSSLSSYNAKFRLIPFSTISESGVLPAFKPNKVEISYLGKVLEKDAFVCACKQKIADEKFKALVSQEMVD